MKELRLLTYNIHKGIGTDRAYNLERILNICRDAQADIIALQEVGSFLPQSENGSMAEILSKDLSMFYGAGLNVYLKKGAYGNASFSRYPIVQSFNLDITVHMKKKRGCFITRIQYLNKDFLILNTHLGLAAFERRRQIQKIITFLKNSELQNMPLILMGDTNDRSHKLNPLLEGAGLTDTASSFPLEKKSSYTFPSYTPILRLDKIFFSSHWNVQKHYVIRDKMTRISSDHLPLFAQLSLES